MYSYEVAFSRFAASEVFFRQSRLFFCTHQIHGPVYHAMAGDGFQQLSAELLSQ
jgi:hypothetical protein